MSTTENTTAIDDKKTEDTGTTTSNKLYSFTLNYISSIIFTVGVSIVLIGTLGLYTTKVAQSNILPDNIELAPFTNIMRNVEEIQIDMHTVRDVTWSGVKNTVTQKGFFDSKHFLENFKDTLAGKTICALKSVSTPTSGPFANAGLYWSNVYNSIIATNFTAINTIFFYLSYLPESVIMILYSFLGIFIWTGLYFINFVFGAFYHVINILELFRNTLPKDETKWEAPADTTIFSWKLVFFAFVWWWIILMSIFITPVITTFLGLITPLQTRYKLNKDSNKHFSLADFLMDTIVYKRSFIIILATISLINNAYNNLGSQYMIGVIIAIIVAYFLGLYNQPIPELEVNGFSKNKANINIVQAKATAGNNTNIAFCPEKNINLIQKGGLKKNKNNKSK
jgi:hypothetical protein